MASKSVVTLNHQESECFKLESELNRLKAQLSQVKRENEMLRQRLDSNTDGGVLSTSPPITRQHHRSPDEFVDIGAYSMAEQIETYLVQTDALFSDDVKLQPALEYLIKKVWSIIAHEYDEKSLDNSRKARDSLLLKLNRTCEAFSCVDMLENELERMKKDTYTLKDKVIKQNDMIKSLLTSMQKSGGDKSSLPNGESLVIIDSVVKKQEPIAMEHANGNTNDQNEQEEDEETVSPSTSPSSSFSSHLSKLLNNNSNRREVRTIDTISTAETTSMYSSANQQQQDEEENTTTLQHEEQHPASNNSSNDNQTSQEQPQQEPQQQQPQTQQQRAPNDFILYGVNDGDYIGVGHTQEVDTNRLQNYLETASAHNNTQPTTSTSTTNAPIRTTTTSRSPWLYQCPKCETSIDPAKIRWERFVEHMNTCDAEHNNICMFCLMSFPKDQGVLFEEHVQSHIEVEF